MDTVDRKSGQPPIEKLWECYLADPTAARRNDLVLAYGWLVRRIAFRLRGSYGNYGQLDDMVNQGMIALIDAVERFDPDKKAKFETFASMKIKGAIIDFIREQDWVPRNQRTMAREVDATYGKLYTQHGREPSREEVAEGLGISPVHLDKILQQRHGAIILSYEEMIQEKMMVASPLDTLTHDEYTPEEEVLFGELKAGLTQAIEELGERERLVITLYYYEHLKLKEIAEILEVSESRVSQIHSATIIKLKHRLAQYQ